LYREEWPQIRRPHMPRHVGWAWPAEENEQAVCGKTIKPSLRGGFWSDKPHRDRGGLLGEGSDNGSKGGRGSGRCFRNIPAIAPRRPVLTLE